jgi:DNA-binding MarR family transcriptional regulator
LNHSQDLQQRVKEFVRAFGLHQPDQTPCGLQIAVSDALALSEIAGYPSITQRELSERLLLEKSTVSRLVGKLEDRGWVVRRRSDHDRRVMTLSLTKQGQLVAEKIAAARAQKFADIWSLIPPREHENVVRSLDTLIKAISETTEGAHAKRQEADDYAYRSVAGVELHER